MFGAFERPPTFPTTGASPMNQDLKENKILTYEELIVALHGP
jgi:hypothetical protein